MRPTLLYGVASTTVFVSVVLLAVSGALAAVGNSVAGTGASFLRAVTQVLASLY